MISSKNSARQHVWSYLEKNNIARFPTPVHNRTPNFEGAEIACCKVKELPEYQVAQTIKVTPFTPQQNIRFLILEDQKTLLVKTPRVRNGPHLIDGILNKITLPRNATINTLHMCSGLKGVKRHSVPLKLDSKIKVDLVILGSVAVSPTGRRIGKGEGYSDLEFAIMATIGAVNSDTVVVTTVHDCQILDLPDKLFGPQDLPVDIIVTPTKIIRCEPRLPKPDRIIWSLLSEEKMNRMPVLKLLKSMEEGKQTESNSQNI